jgi:ribonuclease T2
MRYLLFATLVGGLFPTLPAQAETFDYYVFSLSWSPEFCHDNPKNKTDECNAQAKMNFVVHGLWPSNNDGSDPSGCPTTSFDASAVPKNLSSIMPSSIFKHEWETHGVCSGMTESVYFQRIASLFGSLAIPLKNTGADQQVTPLALRQQLAQANAGTTPQSFAIEDKSRYLTEVRECFNRAFAAIACPRPGDVGSAPITIRAKP